MSLLINKAGSGTLRPSRTSICRRGTGVVGPAVEVHVILENDDGRPAALVSDRASGGCYEVSAVGAS
jgi:hypothetical protein